MKLDGNSNRAPDNSPLPLVLGANAPTAGIRSQFVRPLEACGRSGMIPTPSPDPRRRSGPDSTSNPLLWPQLALVRRSGPVVRVCGRPSSKDDTIQICPDVVVTKGSTKGPKVARRRVVNSGTQTGRSGARPTLDTERSPARNPISRRTPLARPTASTCTS